MRFYIAAGGVSFNNSLGQLTTVTRGQILDTAACSVPPGWTIPGDSGSFYPMDQAALQMLQNSIAAEIAKNGGSTIAPPGVISLAPPSIFAP
jgi:hypothetical protein